MKHLLVLFMLSMTLQPLAVSTCPMADDQQPAHHAVMDRHGDSNCCSADLPGPMEDCANAAQCAFLSLGFLVIPPATASLETPTGHDYLVTDSDAYSGPPAPRLFRPPIA